MYRSFRAAPSCSYQQAAMLVSDANVCLQIVHANLQRMLSRRSDRIRLE